MNISRSPGNFHSERRPVQFDIYSLDSVAADDMLLLSPHMHAFLWFQKGTGNILIDTYRHDLQDDTVYQIKPRQLVKAVVPGPAKGFLISFDIQFLGLFEKKVSLTNHDLLHQHSFLSQIIPINNDTSLLLENIVGKMLHEFKGYHDHRTEVLSSFLKIFIIYLTRQRDKSQKEQEQCRKSELASLFFSLLEEHFADKKLVKDYADILLVTPGYVNKVIKEITGFTASYHIQQRIVLEAKRRVLSGGNNLKEIAYTLGFCDPAHFSKFFKSGAGTNFTSFKRTAFSDSTVL